MPVNGAILVYGIIMIALGIHGAMQGSMVSLAAAGTIGVLMIGTTALHKSHPRPARIGAAVLALLTMLMEFKSYQFPKADKVTGIVPESHFYPHGFAAVLSLMLFIVLGMGHMLARGRGPDGYKKGGDNN